jgi:hypothetical protein
MTKADIVQAVYTRVGGFRAIERLDPLAARHGHGAHDHVPEDLVRQDCHPVDTRTRPELFT